MTTTSWMSRHIKGWGRINVAVTPKGVSYISFRKIDSCFSRSKSRELHSEQLEKAMDQIEGYLNGDLKRFTLKIDLSAETSFTQQVLEESSKIRFGETLSYGELAKKIGKPNGARAVGQAMGRNPLLLVVP